MAKVGRGAEEPPGPQPVQHRCREGRAGGVEDQRPVRAVALLGVARAGQDEGRHLGREVRAVTVDLDLEPGAEGQHHLHMVMGMDRAGGAIGPDVEAGQHGRKPCGSRNTAGRAGLGRPSTDRPGPEWRRARCGQPSEKFCSTTASIETWLDVLLTWGRVEIFSARMRRKSAMSRERTFIR